VLEILVEFGLHLTGFLSTSHLSYNGCFPISTHTHISKQEKMTHVSMSLCTIVLVTLVVCSSTHASELPNLGNNARFQAAMADVNAQVENQLGSLAYSNTPASASGPSASFSVDGPAPQVVAPPTELGASFESNIGAPGAEMRFASSRAGAKTNDALNTRMFNGLDLKSPQPEVQEEKPEKHSREAAVSYSSIAKDTVSRAYTAYEYLRHHIAALSAHIKADRHNTKAYVANQRAVTMGRIKAEEQHIARLTDEVLHLQNIYKDAVSKDQSYQQQAENLMTERQLQRTPPMMPDVAAAAVTDEQYNKLMEKLKRFRDMAAKVMKTTAEGISKRQHAIQLSTDWVIKSKKALEKWIISTNKQAAKWTASNVKHLQLLQRRAKTVRNIYNQANKYYKTYSLYVKAADMQAHVDKLAEEEKKYSSEKGANAYDTAKYKAWAQASKYEREQLEAKVKALGAPATIKAPPSIWGVLSGFHPGQPTSLHASGPNSPGYPYPSAHVKNGLDLGDGTAGEDKVPEVSQDDVKSWMYYPGGQPADPSLGNFFHHLQTPGSIPRGPNVHAYIPGAKYEPEKEKEEEAEKEAGSEKEKAPEAGADDKSEKTENEADKAKFRSLRSDVGAPKLPSHLPTAPQQPARNAGLPQPPALPHLPPPPDAGFVMA
jgi:hypothetical protein